MNETIQTILSRRSIRVYEDKPIDRETLSTILEAGQYAPSAVNAQEWRFVVVTTAEFRAKLVALAQPRYRKWIEGASRTLKDMRAEIDSIATDPVYYGASAFVFVVGWGMTAEFDCPMVCQNMMLAAASLGLGSCWVYSGQLVLDDPEIRGALELQGGEKVFGPILLGHPKSEQPPRPERKAVSAKWL